MATNSKMNKSDLDKCYYQEVLRGKGAFGKVHTYLVKPEHSHTNFRKRVAVKSIGDHNIQSADREISNLSLLVNEPNIVTMIGYDKWPYTIIMECCATDLGTYVKKRGFGLTTMDLAKISKDILYGMEALFKRGILHRDIKPRNLLVDFTGTDGTNVLAVIIKICDLGCSRRVDLAKMIKGQLEGLTTDIGTDGFIAPEVYLLGDDEELAGHYNNLSDVWGFGSTLFYLCSEGMTPFVKEFLGALQKEINSIERRNKEIVSKIRECVKPEYTKISEVIKRALNWSPEERYSAEKCLGLVQYLEENEKKTNKEQQTETVCKKADPVETPKAVKAVAKKISDTDLQKTKIVKEDIALLLKEPQIDDQLTPDSITEVAKNVFPKMKIERARQPKPNLLPVDAFKSILETWCRRKKDRATLRVLSKALQESGLPNLVPVITRVVRNRVDSEATNDVGSLPEQLVPILDEYRANIREHKSVIVQVRPYTAVDASIMPELERRKELTKLYIPRCYENVETGEQVTQLDQLFSGSRRVTFVRGDPGVGKTVLFEWMMIKWAQNEDLDQFELIISMPCRSLKEGVEGTAEDMVFHFSSVEKNMSAVVTGELTFQHIKEIAARRKLLVSFDGIDEIRLPTTDAELNRIKSQLLKAIITGKEMVVGMLLDKLLPGAFCLLTGRNTAVRSIVKKLFTRSVPRELLQISQEHQLELHQEDTFDGAEVFELKPFTEGDVVLFCHNYLDCNTHNNVIVIPRHADHASITISDEDSGETSTHASTMRDVDTASDRAPMTKADADTDECSTHVSIKEVSDAAKEDSDAASNQASTQDIDQHICVKVSNMINKLVFLGDLIYTPCFTRWLAEISDVKIRRGEDFNAEMTNLASILTDLIFSRLREHCQMDYTEVESFHSLPQHLVDGLQTLAKISFFGLKNGLIDMPATVTRTPDKTDYHVRVGGCETSILLSTFNAIGIMRLTPMSFGNAVVGPIHLVNMEHLAAVHMAQWEVEEWTSMLLGLNEERQVVILKMMAGLCSQQQGSLTGQFMSVIKDGERSQPIQQIYKMILALDEEKVPRTDVENYVDLMFDVEEEVENEEMRKSVGKTVKSFVINFFSGSKMAVVKVREKQVLLSRARQSLISSLTRESHTLVDSSLFLDFLRTGPPPPQQYEDYEPLEFKMKVGSPGPVSVSFKNSPTELNSPPLLSSAAWMWTTVQDEVELTAEWLKCRGTYFPRPIARQVGRVLASARRLWLVNVESGLEEVAVELAEAAQRPGARLEELLLGRLNRAEVHGAAAALAQLAPHLRMLKLWGMKPSTEVWKQLSTKISAADTAHLKLERLMIECDMEEANPEDAAKLFSSIPWITLFDTELKVPGDVWAAFTDSVVEGSNQVVPHLQLGRVDWGTAYTTDLRKVPEDVISRLIANLEEVTLEGKLKLSDTQWQRITEEVEKKRRDGSAKLAKFNVHKLEEECKKNEFIKRIKNAI